MSGVNEEFVGKIGETVGRTERKSVEERARGDSLGKGERPSRVRDRPSRVRGDTLGKELDEAWEKAESRAPLVVAMEVARSRLLKKIGMTERDLVKLVRILDAEREKSTTASNLMCRFALRCYGKSRESLKQTKTFVEVAFGDHEKLYRLGPTRAFEDRVRAIAEPEAPKKKKSQWKFEFGKYLVGKVLGIGGQATVYLGYDTKLHKQVAMKVFKKEFIEEAIVEKEILESLPDHRNVIKLLDGYLGVRWQGTKTVVLVLELADRGEVIEYLIGTKRRFEPALARRIFRGILSGLHHCHSQETTVVHRDLKLENVLFATDPETGEINVKISDFGYAGFLEYGEVMKKMVGTENYAASEILYSRGYNEKVDIFSVGVMLFVMLSNMHPFQRADHHDPWYKYPLNGDWQTFWRTHMRGSRKYQFSAVEKDLIQGMLDPNPRTRYTLEQIFNHRWMDGPCMSAEAATQALEERYCLIHAHKAYHAALSEAKSAINGDSSDLN